MFVNIYLEFRYYYYARFLEMNLYFSFSFIME